MNYSDVKLHEMLFLLLKIIQLSFYVKKKNKKRVSYKLLCFAEALHLHNE